MSVPTTKQELRAWIEEYCRGEKNHGEPNTWDVTLVTDMSELFRDMPLFNAPIDQWDTSQVTNMSWMFMMATVVQSTARLGHVERDGYELHVLWCHSVQSAAHVRHVAGDAYA